MGKNHLHRGLIIILGFLLPLSIGACGAPGTDDAPRLKTVDDEGDVGSACQLAVDGDNLYATYEDLTNNDIKFAKSTDRGDTWTVTPVFESGTDSIFERSAMAADGSDICIAYRSKIGSVYSIHCINSHDGGDTWSSPVEIYALGAYPSLAMNGSNVYAVFSYASTLYCINSTDGGATWPAGNLKTIEAVSAYGMAVAVVSSSIYVSYVADPGPSGELKLAKCLNANYSWLASNIKTITAYDGGAYTNSIGVVGSNVYVAYRADYDLYCARSTNGGVNWMYYDKLVADDSSGNGPSLTASGTDVFIGCVGNYQELRFTKSNDNGATWEEDDRHILDDQHEYSSVSIATDGNDVFILCRDSTDKALKFIRSTDGGDTW